MFYKCVNSFSCCNSSADNTTFTETESYLRKTLICTIRLIAIFYCYISCIKDVDLNEKTIEMKGLIMIIRESS